MPEEKTETTATSTDAGHLEEGGEAPLEIIRTISRVPGNPNYHLKNGLRTEGDGYDHNAEFKVTHLIAIRVQFKRLTSAAVIVQGHHGHLRLQYGLCRIPNDTTFLLHALHEHRQFTGRG